VKYILKAATEKYADTRDLAIYLVIITAELF
jgi:hypothetical protein